MRTHHVPLLDDPRWAGCAPMQEKSRAAVPGTNLIVVLGEATIARQGNVVTLSWRGSLDTQFAAIDVADCRVVRDSNEYVPLPDLHGCTSHKSVMGAMWTACATVLIA